MAMKAVAIAALKNQLSRHLQAVRRGEVITVLDRKTPIARIVPYPGEEVPLVVRSPLRPWKEAQRERLPRRPAAPTDSLAALLQERQGDR